MSSFPATDDRIPLAANEAAELRARAQEERKRAEKALALAAYLDDVAENGYPAGSGTPWPDVREQHLSELTPGQNGQRAA